MTDPRIPPLTDPARWARCEALFHQASELPHEQRARFLEKQCGDDAALRQAVARLLASDAATNAVIDTPMEALAFPLMNAEVAPELPAGTLIGRYRLLAVLGVGGMGTVYRAERADGAYQRQVAIKMVRAGRMSAELEARFALERQILGRLQHPGIATLVDGGVTPAGQAYLVMELVDGISIVEYARREGLDITQRVALALAVAQAVEYAHRNLVVHRDLKPSNILVDEQGQPRLLDFGIARLIDEEHDLATRTGALLLTPDYAAPEQIRGDPITTATDVHALGAVLYELLTGARPFGRVTASWHDLQRVLEQTPPPLSQVEGLEPAARRALAGDLETIVQKAMQKDPARRYPSAGAFAEDLKRYLSGRPIAARPDSVGYRLGKLVRRNRTVTAVAALLVIAIGVGVGSTLWQARNARIEAERGNAVGQFLFSLFEAADPDRNAGTPPTALELLEAGLARVDSLDAGPEARVDLLTTLGTLFGKLGHADRSVALLRRAADHAREQLPARDPALARALNELGVQLALQGSVTESEAMLREALALRRAHGAPLLDLGATESNLALALRRQGQYVEAESLYHAAISRRVSDGTVDSAAIASELLGLGQVYQFMGETSRAESLFRVVRRIETGRLRSQPRLGIAIHNLGVVLAEQERYPEALTAHHAALAVWQTLFPRGHPEMARSLEAIGRVMELQGRWAEADSVYHEAIARWSALYGEGTSNIATIRANQANLRYFAGDFDAAAEAYRDGIRIWRANDERILLGTGLRNLGIIERERGDLVAADSLLMQALAVRRAINGDVHTSVAETHTAIAGLRNAERRYPDAEGHARAAATQYGELLDPGHRLIHFAQLELGVALAAQRRFDEARATLEPVYGAFAQSLNAADRGRGRAALWLGITLAGLGQRERARELVREALPGLATLPSSAPERLRANQELARLER